MVLFQKIWRLLKFCWWTTPQKNNLSSLPLQTFLSHRIKFEMNIFLCQGEYGKWGLHEPFTTGWSDFKCNSRKLLDSSLTKVNQDVGFILRPVASRFLTTFFVARKTRSRLPAFRRWLGPTVPWHHGWKTDMSWICRKGRFCSIRM